MQLSCPSCHTAFHVDPAALGAEGRSVRCARCRTTWFARPADVAPTPAMAEPVFDSAIEIEAAPAADPAAVVALPRVVPMNDTVMVELNPSPPLAPGPASLDIAPRPQAARAGRPPVPRATAKPRTRATASPAQRRLGAVAALIAALMFSAISLRASIVRSAPDLAGLYAAIGLPVNLRGLEFAKITTTHEAHDGIPVLVIEGEIVNVTRQPVEVPRLRFAVLGTDARELYSWTALMPRSVLPEGESIPFRSRLASPPPEGKQVLVRFLNRLDLTATAR